MTAQINITNSQETLYNQDYYLWLSNTAKLLKQKEFSKLDLENLIEEIESLGKSEKRAIKSNLIIVILHLLKWRYQPKKRSNSWKSSIREHRRRIQELFTDSPSAIDLKKIRDNKYKSIAKVLHISKVMRFCFFYTFGVYSGRITMRKEEVNLDVQL